MVQYHAQFGPSQATNACGMGAGVKREEETLGIAHPPDERGQFLANLSITIGTELGRRAS